MTSSEIHRRTFLQRAGGMMVGGAAAVACGIPGNSRAQTPSAAKQTVPIKIGIRAATMKMVGNLDVVRTAAAMPGIMGVELQVTAGTPNLRDWDAVRNYKRQA